MVKGDFHFGILFETMKMTGEICEKCAYKVCKRERKRMKKIGERKLIVLLNYNNP